MDPVNRLDQVLQIIGRQMSERAARLEAGAKSSAGARSARTPGRPSLAALKSTVKQRLRTLDPNDARRSDKARRIFLESVLAWQFGDELLLDRGFDEIVSGVQEALSANPEVDARFAQLLRELTV
jgi:hypothetical protein